MNGRFGKCSGIIIVKAHIIIRQRLFFISKFLFSDPIFLRDFHDLCSRFGVTEIYESLNGHQPKDYTVLMISDT